METTKNFLKGKTPQNDQEQEGNEKKEISDEEACEFLRFITSFQALEIVGMMYVEPPRVNPCLSNAH